MTPFKRKLERNTGGHCYESRRKNWRPCVLGTNPVGRPETVCFLAQQVVEKALKAVICHLDQPVPLIHDIGGLIAALPEAAGRPPRDTELPALSEFATVRRYEEGPYRLAPEEVAAAVAAAGSVVSWAKGIVAGAEAASKPRR